MSRILYLVHNLNDAAVERRVRMLQAGDADLALAGFWRGKAPSPVVDGASAIGLGETRDASLIQRAWMVARHVANPSAMRAAAEADVLLARNLE